MLGDISGVEHIYLACGYTDLRRGIDGLAQLVQQQFSLDPFSNSLFLFCGRRCDRIKAQSFLLAVPLFQKTASFLKIIKEQNRINWNTSTTVMFPVIPDQCSDNILWRFCPCKEIFFADIQNSGYFLDSILFGRSESRLILGNAICCISIQVQSFSQFPLR